MLYGIFNKVEIEKKFQRTKGQSKKITEIGSILLDRTRDGVDYMFIPLQSSEATFSVISGKHIATFELDEESMKTWKTIDLPYLQKFSKLSTFFLEANMEFEGLIDQINSAYHLTNLNIDIDDIDFDYYGNLYKCDVIKKSTIAQLREKYNFQFH